MWRLGRSGLVTHLGGGWYTHAFARPAVEELSALLVGPSYVSLETVLSRHGVTTQRSAFLTCVTLAPTQKLGTPLGEIRYHKVSRDLFWGFDLRRGPSALTYWEAWPEKALLDHIYLSRKRGHQVWLDLDFSRLDAGRLGECAGRFPESVRQMLKQLRFTRSHPGCAYFSIEAGEDA